METTSIQNPHAIDSPRSGWAQLGRRLLLGSNCGELHAPFWCLSVLLDKSQAAQGVSGRLSQMNEWLRTKRQISRVRATLLALGNRTENVVSESTNRPNISPKGYLETFILYLIVTSNVVLKTILRSKAFFLHANQKALNACVCSGHIH